MLQRTRSRPCPHGRHNPQRRRRLAAVIAALLTVLIGTPQAGVAQQGQVGGRVVTEAGQPVPGARVGVQGTTRAVITDPEGAFRLGGLTGTQVTLQVDRIGYARVTRVAAVGDMNLRFALSEAALTLDALVVTGAPGGTERRAVGNAVSTLDAAEVVRTQPVNSVQDLLTGRTPGVVIIPATGNIGGGSRIRVRGVSSFSLAQEPLIYVDGVRVNNQAATGPINQGFGSNSISRFNDINPDDIESIEIIRGPAAATLYGTEASNGVIQIITKRGAVGSPVWDVGVRRGAVWFGNAENRVWTNYGEFRRGDGTVDTTTINILRMERERGTPVWQTGSLQSYNLAVSGGSPLFRYYVGGNLDRDEGIEPNNTLRRWSTRLNASAQPHDKIDLRASSSYTQGTIHLPLEAGGGGSAWSVFFANPARLDPLANGDPNPRRGFHSGTPEAYRHAYQDWQDVNRFIGSIEANHRPNDWLSHRLGLGIDVTRENNVELVQRIEDPAFQFFFSPNEIRGYRDQTTRHVTFGTIDYSATGTFSPRENLSSSTTLGAQIYRRYSEFVFAFGRGFPVRGLTAVTAAPEERQGSHNQDEDVTVGVFAQQQFGWRNRVFLTGALRADDNSAFGEQFDLVYYPKLSGTWVVSEEPFWRFGWFDELKLRAAYGETGQQPQTFTALRTYRVVPGPNDVSTVTPNLIGNPNLGPERGKEVEIGFDAGLLGNRLGIDFTFYNQRITDAILLRDMPPSTGFPGQQYVNAGVLRNRGIEMGLRALALDTRNVDLDLVFNIATNQNRIVDLGIEGLTAVQAGTYVRHVEGYPAGAWWEKRIVDATFDANGKLVANSEICDDGTGGRTPCANAPLVYLGRPTPAREGAFIPTLTLFERLRLGAMVDFKRDFHKLDGNLRVRCVLFFRCRENFYPQEYVNDPAWLAQVQRGGAFVNGLINDASFTRLRELSATYTLPDGIATRFGATRASISVAGRNLYTWTNYTGIEPEASFLGGSRGGGSAQWEQNVTPQLQQFVTTINLTF
jgi:TonB-linked SusC/RagA family outer membrane protein